MKKILIGACVALMVATSSLPGSAAPSVCIPNVGQTPPNCSNSIWGYVRDHRWNPVQGATVYEGEYSATTNSQGYFEIVDISFYTRTNFSITASWIKNSNQCLSFRNVSRNPTVVQSRGLQVDFQLSCFAPSVLHLSSDREWQVTGEIVQVYAELKDAYGVGVGNEPVHFDVWGTGGETPESAVIPSDATGYATLSLTSVSQGTSVVWAEAYGSSYYLSDSIQIEWIEPEPPPPPPPPPPPEPEAAQVELFPEVGDALVGAPYSATASATNSSDQPVSDGTWISFAVDGPEGGIYSGYDIVAVARGPGGYWIVTSGGKVFSFGSVAFHGDASVITLNHPIVGMAGTPSGNGYWLVASDGGIFAFGDAGFYGSTGGIALNEPIVGMAATPSGEGYWLVAADGGIFTFGDAGFYGSTGGVPLNNPIVGMATTPSGEGYWLVASDSGIFTFGDAEFYGSMGGTPLNYPIVGMAGTPSGNGYWTVASDGGIFSFGDGTFYGSAGGTPLTASIVGMFSGDAGYTLAAGDGQVFAFGTNTFEGSLYATQTSGGLAAFSFTSTAPGSSTVRASIHPPYVATPAEAIVTWLEG